MIINFKELGSGGSGGGVTPQQVREIVNSALTDYTETDDFATINGNAITEGGDIEIPQGAEIVEYDNIDTAKGLEIFANPEKFAIDYSGGIYVFGHHNASEAKFYHLEIGTTANGKSINNQYVEINNGGYKFFRDDRFDVYTSGGTDALLAEKQDVLTAGEGITISGNTISAAGGLEVVDYDNIDTAKALEIFAEPEKYLIKKSGYIYSCFRNTTSKKYFRAYRDYILTPSTYKPWYKELQITIDSTGVLESTEKDIYNVRMLHLNSDALPYSEMVKNPQDYMLKNGSIILHLQGTPTGGELYYSSFYFNSGDNEWNYDQAVVSSDGTYVVTTENVVIPTISVTQTLSAGTKIAEITVNDTTTELYAPNGGSGGDTEELQLAVAAAVNDLKFKTDAKFFNDYLTKKEVNSKLAAKADTVTFNNYYTKAEMETLLAAVYALIEDKELAISAAVNDLNTRINNISE